MAVEIHPYGEAPESDLVEIERRIGQPLPPDYRSWLKSHNGGQILGGGAGVPGMGLYIVVFTRAAMGGDGASNLVYEWESATEDFITRDFLPIAKPDAGLMLLKLTGPDTGSVWWLDDMDMGEEFDAEATGYESEQEYLCAEKLERVADSFDDLLGKLAPFDEID